MSHSRSLFAAICVLCAAALVVVVAPRLNTQRGVSEVDAQMRNSHESYSTGSYREATNSLSTFIQFLETNRIRVSRDRDVERLLYITRIKLAYMLMYSGNEIAACDLMNLAYGNHANLQARVREKPMPRSKFVEFVIVGIEKLDSKSRVGWKSQLSLDTNTFNKLNARFVAEPAKRGD